MKKFFNVVAIALAGVFAMGLVACDGTGGSKTISVNPSALNFTAEGATKKVVVESDTEWSYTNDSWFTVTKTDNTLSVAVSANPTTNQRSGKITVTNADDNVTINVSQAAASTEGGLADALVGTWSAERIFWDNAAKQAYEVPYEVTITKIDNATVAVDGAWGYSTLFNPGFPAEWDDAIININSNGTIGMPSTAMSNFVNDPNIITYNSAHIDASYANCYKKGYDNLPVVNGVINFFGLPEYLSDGQGNSINGSFIPLLEDGGTIYGLNMAFCSVVWTKGSAGAPPMLAPVKELKGYILNPLYDIPSKNIEGIF